MASVRRQPNNVATAEGKSDKKPLVKSEEADSFRSIYDYLFDEVEWRLVATFFAVRGLVFFIVVPILQLCWNRAEFVDLSGLSTLDRFIQYFNVYDARHFNWVGATVSGEGGYIYEINHAFFPFLPWLVRWVPEWLAFPDIQFFGWFYQIALSFTNTILIYRVGNMAFRKQTVAEVAAYIYIVNHAMVYQIALYSENCFLLFTLLGFYILYNGSPADKSTSATSEFWLPESNQVVAACFVFGLATCVRSTGVLLSMFVGFFFLHKIIAKMENCCSLLKIILYCWICMLVMFVPIWVLTNWKPYVLHCDTKLDRTDDVPVWCLTSLPDVYKYIQYVYWDNQFGGIFFRSIDHAIVALPMNFLFFYFIFRIVSEQGTQFFTVGLFTSKVTKEQRALSLFSQIEMVPHAWYMFISLALILVFANADINSRAASVCPFYYWGLASLMVEGDGTPEEQRNATDNKGVTKMTWAARIAIGHNLLYMVLNFVTFPMEVAFF